MVIHYGRIYQMSPVDFGNRSENHLILESTIKNLVSNDSRLLLIYLHGSTSKKLNTPLSDIDLAFFYAFEDVNGVSNRKQILLQLISFFEQELPNWDFDIRLLNSAPIDFSFSVISGKLLYAKNEAVRVQYETKIIMQYLDFKPIIDYYLKVQEQMLLEGSP